MKTEDRAMQARELLREMGCKYGSVKFELDISGDVLKETWRIVACHQDGRSLTVQGADLDKTLVEVGRRLGYEAENAPREVKLLPAA